MENVAGRLVACLFPSSALLRALLAGRSRAGYGRRTRRGGSALTAAECSAALVNKRERVATIDVMAGYGQNVSYHFCAGVRSNRLTGSGMNKIVRSPSVTAYSISSWQSKLGAVVATFANARSSA